MSAAALPRPRPRRLALFLALSAACGLLAALLARPAAADHVAGTTYQGTHSGGGTVSFVIGPRGAAVLHFEATGIPVSGSAPGCGPATDDSAIYDGGEETANPTLPINNHVFADRDPRGLVPAGSFSAGGRASGTFTWSNFRGADCRGTGTFTWSASTGTAQPSPSPSARPTPPPSPPPSTRPSPSPSPAPVADSGRAMNLMVAVRTGDGLAPNGTEVVALVNGIVCESDTTAFGFVVLIVPPASERPGCGRDGAFINFTVDGNPARQTQPWREDTIFQPVAISTSGSVARGVQARPVLETDCREPDSGRRCNEYDAALWESSIVVWENELRRRGVDPSFANILNAWLEFRIERGDIVSRMLRAYLSEDAEAATYINRVRYSPSPEEPVPFVEIISVGSDRDMGGWTIQTQTGWSYTFPAGFVMPTGECRVYLGLPPEDDFLNECAGAVFTGGTGPLATPESGRFGLRTPSGVFIDTTGW